MEQVGKPIAIREDSGATPESRGMVSSLPVSTKSSSLPQKMKISWKIQAKISSLPLSR
jgi:hypothetical protein